MIPTMDPRMSGAEHINRNIVNIFVYSPTQIPLRQWAYVLWDRARLDEWEVFEKPWEGIDVAEYERQEESRRLLEAGGMQIRAQNMVRDGMLEASWRYF